MAAADRPVRTVRPVYLNLAEIRQPVAAVVSILHRISGAALFLIGIPLLLWGLQSSLAAPEGYAGLVAWLGHPVVKIVIVLLLAAYLFHLFAGIRHLMLDMHVGLELASARQSATVVLVVSTVLAIAIAVRLW